MTIRKFCAGLFTALIFAGSLAHAEAPNAQPKDLAAMTDAPRLTPERLYASPALSGPTPRAARFSPDGRRVTFLKPRAEESSRYDLWQFDVASGDQTMLVDSTAIDPAETELSEEEKALRERKRIASVRGIADYAWGTANTIIVPAGGDIHLVTLKKVSYVLNY